MPRYEEGMMEPRGRTVGDRPVGGEGTLSKPVQPGASDLCWQ